MFFLHERGSRMGIYTLCIIAAPYLGAVSGGSIIYNASLGWKWSQYIAIILYSVLFLVQTFFGKPPKVM
jgi:MFS family permease